MKYYKLKLSRAGKYGYFKGGKIYREDARTTDGHPVLSCVRDNPDDWEEVEGFLFGKGYLYEPSIVSSIEYLPNIPIS